MRYRGGCAVKGIGFKNSRRWFSIFVKKKTKTKMHRVRVIVSVRVSSPNGVVKNLATRKKIGSSTTTSLDGSLDGSTFFMEGARRLIFDSPRRALAVIVVVVVVVVRIVRERRCLCILWCCCCCC